mgnify:CR=1 FL=1
MLEQITHLLISLIQQLGYVGVFTATMLESFFAPIPSEVVLPTVGLAAKQSGDFSIVVIASVVAALGNYVGTLPFYYIARVGADSLLPRLIAKYGAFILISMDDVRKAEKLFARRGKLMVFTSRLIPAVRSLIAFPAGISKMHFGEYTLFTLLGSFIWNLVLITVGFVAYDYMDSVFAILKPVENLVLVIIALAIAIYTYKVIRNIIKIRKAQS